MLRKLSNTREKNEKLKLVERTAVYTVITPCGAPCLTETDNKYSFDVCNPT